jgi:hypothetical protein
MRWAVKVFPKAANAPIWLIVLEEFASVHICVYLYKEIFISWSSNAFFGIMGGKNKRE